MNPTLQQTLATYGSFAYPPTAIPCLLGIVLLLVGTLLLIKNSAGIRFILIGIISSYIGIISSYVGFLSLTSNKNDSQMLTEILNNPNWEVTNATVSNDGKLEAITIQSPTQKVETQFLGKPITATIKPKELVLWGELLNITTSNQELNATLLTKIQVAQTR